MTDQNGLSRSTQPRNRPTDGGLLQRDGWRASATCERLYPTWFALLRRTAYADLGA